jgi:archaellin
MPTVADLCALNSWYTTQYGDLYDDLDSDIDGSDFTKYVWSAIAPKVADAEDDLENTEKTKVTGGTKTKKYKVCSGTYTQGCYSEAIKKVQGCLGGLVADGKFGPKTNGKLKEAGFSSGFSDNDVDKICDKKDTANNTGYEDYTTDEIETSVEPTQGASAPANVTSVQQSKKSFIGPPNDDAVEQ